MLPEAVNGQSSPALPQPRNFSLSARICRTSGARSRASRKYNPNQTTMPTMIGKEPMLILGAIAGG